MLSVILVNWNNWSDTLACIQSLLNSDDKKIRIIVVDNSLNYDSLYCFYSWANHELELVHNNNNPLDSLSVHGSKMERSTCFLDYNCSQKSFYASTFYKINNKTKSEPIVHFIRSGRNGGFGYGCNVGLLYGKNLGSDAYWLLNNDCLVTPSTVRDIKKRINFQAMKIYGTILRFYDNSNIIQAVGGGYFNKFTGSVKTETKINNRKSLSFINGASLIMTDRCYEELGGFDESIFMYFEENDLCIRASNLGYTFDYIDTQVFHKHGGSQGDSPSVSAWSNVLENKRYVLNKNLGLGPWLIFYLFNLILRSFIPMFDRNSRLGARIALKNFFKGSSSQ